MPTDIDARLAVLGLKLPDAPAPAANYVSYTIAKGLKHTRSALGVFSLRGNVPVVIDAIFDLAD